MHGTAWGSCNFCLGPKKQNRASSKSSVTTRWRLQPTLTSVKSLALSLSAGQASCPTTTASRPSPSLLPETTSANQDTCPSPTPSPLLLILLFPITPLPPPGQSWAGLLQTASAPPAALRRAPASVTSSRDQTSSRSRSAAPTVPQ